MDKLLLGIDFGTSTNYVTKYDFGKQDAVAVANMGSYANSNIFENTIYIESGSNVVLGSAASKRGTSDPLNFFRGIKRYISSEQWYQKIPHLDNRMYSAQDIASMIFKEIKEKVEKSENKSIDGVVLTVPYSYSDRYRSRLKEAAEDAGLHVLKLIEEPVAAAVSFGIFEKDLQINHKEKMLVFDLGGGTFDITIFEMEKLGNGQVKIEVLNTDGVENLGGEDIDEVLMSKFRALIGIQYDDIANETELKDYQELLKKTAMETKENLSVDDIYESYAIITINGKTEELEYELSRDEFATWMKTNNILGQIEDAIDRSLMDVGDDGLEVEEIDRVILAGGSSNIPLIHYLTEKYFGKKPESRKNLGELVGHGAGIVAGLTEDKSLNYEIIRKVSKNVGIAKGNKFETVLPKNTNYGVKSDLHTISIQNVQDGELRITFYEGDSSIVEHCEIVGSIVIDVSAVEGNDIGISLEKDESEGRLVYHIYDNDTEIETNNIDNN